MTIEKFAFPSASDVQCRDRRRLDPSMRIVPGTDCAALRYETKSPRPGLHNRSRGLLLVQRGCRLPAGLEAGSAADLEAGSATRAAARAAAKDVTAGDKFDPKRTVVFVV